MRDQYPIIRNSITGMTDAGAHDGRVGGRQDNPHLPQEGGGYLDICTEQDSLSGDRLLIRELRRMGLSRCWVDVARVVGPQRFLAIWRLLDQEDHVEHGRLLIRIPRFSQYRRFQRNRYIQALAQAGHTGPDIRRMVSQELGEKISLRHVERLMKGS